jgi:cell division protein FtsN
MSWLESLSISDALIKFPMAHQDYVERKQNKGKSPYKKGADEQPKGIPLRLKLLMLVAVGIVGSFSYFLWFIDNNDAKPIDPEAVSNVKEEKTKAQLPAPPKEKWAYRKELEGKKIEEGQYEVKQGGPYKMQCGSFKTMKQAEILKANIAFAGLSAQVSKSVGSKSTYYKVFLGPYEKKRDAERDKHKLKRNKINYCQIWLWK